MLNKLLIISAILILYTTPSIAQSGYTSVTATVKDANNTLYVNAPFTVSFYDPGTSGKLPLLNRSTFQQSYTGYSTDSSGRIAISLPDNGVIASTSGATGTQWTFSICTATGTFTTRYCIPNITLTITGATQDISTAITAVAPILPTSASCPNGVSGTIQFNSSGSCVGASGLVTDGSSLRIKGPNPYVDISAYGARAIASNLANWTTTCTINATSTSMTLGAASIYQNGDGIACLGAGATNSMSTPTATLTPAEATGPMGSGLYVASPTGSSSYSYKVIWGEAGMGYTAASVAASTTTGQPLGQVTGTITSSARSGTAVTVTTAAPHTLPIGCSVNACPEVLVYGSSDASFTGFVRIISIADNTHFVYTSPVSTTWGGTTSSTGGTYIQYNENHIDCGAVPGGLKTPICYVYGRTGGAFNLIGESRPGETYWDDFGTTLSANPILPAWIPATAPSSATNDALVTTVVSGGGTTSIGVANAATNTVSTPSFATFDNCPLIQAAATAANTGGAAVYIPPTNPATHMAFVTGSYCAIPAHTNIQQAGDIWLTNTITTTSDTTWTAGRANGGNGGGIVYVSNVAPGMYITNGATGNILDGLTFSSQNSNNALLVLSDEGAINLRLRNSFNVGSSATEDTGIAWVQRGAGFDEYFNYNTFLSGHTNGASNLGDTTTPLVMFFGDIGDVFMDSTEMYAKGIASVGAATYGLNFVFNHGHIQGPITPLFTTDGYFGYVRFDNFIMDSTAAQVFTMLHSLGWTSPAQFNFTYTGATDSGSNAFPPTTSGGIVADLEVTGMIAGHPFGQNFNAKVSQPQTLQYAGTGITGSAAGSIQKQLIPNIVPSGNPSPSAYENLITITSLTPSNGTGLAAGTYCYQVAPVYPSGLEGAAGPCTNITTSAPNLSVAVLYPATPGAVAYNTYASNSHVHNCGNITGLTCNSTSTFLDGGGAATSSADGYPHFGSDGIRLPLWACNETTAPSGLAGWDFMWCDSTDHRWKVNNNNGTSSDVATLADFAAPPAIGSGTPAGGAFTTLSASSTVSGTGFSTYLASPPAIGGTAPAAGKFTTLTETNLLISNTAPTISAHFNTSGDSISANNGTAAFTVTVGTGAAGNTGAVGLPTATTGWNCVAQNRNRAAYIQQTGSTTASATFTNYGTTVGTPVNWTNADVLGISCFAY